MNDRSPPILLKNSKIAASNIFAIGTKYLKPPPNLLALIHKCFRVAIIEKKLPPRSKFPKPSLWGGKFWIRGKGGVFQHYPPVLCFGRSAAQWGTVQTRHLNKADFWCARSGCARVFYIAIFNWTSFAERASVDLLRRVTCALQRRPPI